MHGSKNSSDPPGKRREGCDEAVPEYDTEAAWRRFKAELERTPEITDEEFMAEFEAADEDYARGLTVVLPWDRASVPANNEEELMTDISVFLRALHFAADMHRDQRRKDPHASPYINHPICVAQILSDIGGVDDLDVLSAAVLHDTVEDTEATMHDIELAFGMRIARIVEEVTDDKLLEKAERKQAQVDHAPHISREGALVKVADKIANVRDVGANPPKKWAPERRQQYLDWAERVVQRCKPDNPALTGYFYESLANARDALAEDASSD